MALQPPKMLSFDWNAPPSLPAARQQRTFVVVRLFDLDGKSHRVTLHQTAGRRASGTRPIAYFDRAGQRVANLKKRHESGPRELDRNGAELASARARRGLRNTQAGRCSSR